ncbi:MAG: SIMPL domain-containing protein [Alphaproteobacteria bacterium]|nr:SIMPL domain-containing protein [Alphaproteobacteria bacterium]
MIDIQTIFNTTNKILFVISVVILITISIVYIGSRNFSDNLYYVEVKGVAEKIVKADIAIWSISFEVKSNDVRQLYAEIERNIKSTQTFLTKSGFIESEINLAPIDVYQDTYEQAKFRYNAHINISVYTNKIDQVKKVSQNILPLIQQGIIVSGGYGKGVTYEFSDLNSIKPEMLNESVKNAKKSAEQFATSSGASLGRIAGATQGIFSIENKDPGSPEYKKVRVVSTFKFLIK